MASWISLQVGESRPVHEAITCIENNGQRMDYATGRRHGLRRQRQRGSHLQEPR